MNETMYRSPCSMVRRAFGLLLAGALAAHAEDVRDLAAAQAGDVDAMLRVAYQYRDDAKDYPNALYWFRKAADLGNIAAVDNVGWMTEVGWGTHKDLEKARTLYQQAADAGHPQAQVNLARCLKDGLSGPRDPEAAFTWAMMGYRTGKDPRAAKVVAELLLLKSDLRPHAALLEELAGSHQGDVLLLIARVYKEGFGGIPNDADKAGVLVERARQSGLAKDVLDLVQLEQLATKPDVKGSFVFLPTTHLDQGYNMCAPTAAAMALGYYQGTLPDPYAIKTNSTGATQIGTGTAWDCLMHGVKAVSGHDWEFRSWPLDDAGFAAGFQVLLAELDAARVALIDLGPHTVVLVGYDAKERIVYIQNPANNWPGVHTVSYERLKAEWHSPWHVTTTRGVEARPVLLTGSSARSIPANRSSPAGTEPARTPPATPRNEQTSAF